MYRPVPSRVDFASLEEEVLRFWDERRVFARLIEQNASGPRWSFIDGPITANNPMGVHHAWGRTYKDVFQRYRAMQGFRQRFQNGFDCQGLWVEVEVEKELGFNSKREIEAYGLERFAERCKERVYRYADLITRQSIRLGQWMRWDDSYYTLSDDNIQHIWHFLKTCHQKGWLYRGARSMPWCIRCETGLSQHELVGTDSYQEITHESVYLKLPIVGREREYFLVWTTTPWTLSANVALAVHPDLDYVKVRQGDEIYYLSAGTIGALEGPYEVVDTLRGSQLVGLRYRGPFDELPAQQGVEHRVVEWEEVGEEEGTGIVHIAPGCGAEDYELSRVHGLAVIVPLDEKGDYREGFGPLSGRNVRTTNPSIFESLRAKGLVYRIHDYTHRYPTCWRCHEELVFRLAEAWYISVDEIRAQMKRANQEIEWIPPSGGKRMEDWLNNMGDWNISRSRFWGLPLPFYPCEQCGELTVIGTMAELRERAVEGLEQLRELHRPWIDAVKIRCPKCGATVSRIAEVGDAWLDAGIVPFSTLAYLHDREYWREWFPADFITEMREQIRLWFYSMLFMSVALEQTTPYRKVLAYEKLLDERGQPMHRSLGNVIWFDEAVRTMSADVMRWMYARQNVGQNILFGYTPAEEVKRKLLTLWNTYSFFVTYAEIDGFDPTRTPAVPYGERSLLDRWILARLHDLLRLARDRYDQYDVAAVTAAAERFWDDLSTWYVRRSRRRFWKSADDADKRAAYHTLHEALVTLVRVLAPVLPFLAEELYQNLVRSVDAAAPESVHLTRFPAARTELIDESLLATVERVREIVSLGRAARSEAKVRVRQPLAELRVAGAGAPPPSELVEDMAEELNVRRVVFVDTLGDAVRRVARPKPELLGPKYGPKYPEILRGLRAGEYRVNADGSVEVAGLTLAPGEAEVVEEAAPGWTLAQEDDYRVALDVRLTPELLAEGRAREVVRHVQDLRKEADFNVADRIELRYDADEPLRSVLAQFRDYVARETLAVTLEPAAPVGPEWATWSGPIDGQTVRLAIRRVRPEHPA